MADGTPPPAKPPADRAAISTPAESVQGRTPRTPVARLARSASNSLNSFVASARFAAMCDDAFAMCDVDGSGTIDAGELFAAILLLNHKLNSLPLGKRQQPPSREAVRAMLEAHAHDKDGTLSRADFLAVCQDLCREVATGVPRNIFITFVLCPAIGMSAKTALMRLVGGLHPHVAWAIMHIPDVVFIPVATAIVTALVPILLERHDEAQEARRRAAAADAAPAESGGGGGEMAPAPPARADWRKALSTPQHAAVLFCAVGLPALWHYLHWRQLSRQCAVEDTECPP